MAESKQKHKHEAKIEEQPTEAPEPELTKEQEEIVKRNPVQVGLHPLGGISLTAFDPQGDSSSTRITLEQAWVLSGHLNALCGMLIEAAYAQAMQQAMEEQELMQNASKLYVPRS